MCLFHVAPKTARRGGLSDVSFHSPRVGLRGFDSRIQTEMGFCSFVSICVFVGWSFSWRCPDPEVRFEGSPGITRFSTKPSTTLDLEGFAEWRHKSEDVL